MVWHRPLWQWVVFGAVLFTGSLLVHAQQGAIGTSSVVQADGWIRNAGETPYSGDGVYNADGTNQSRAQKVVIGATAVYHLKIQNDALVPGVFTVVGPLSQNGWTVRYFDALSGGQEITDSVTKGGLLGLRAVRTLMAGQALDWRLEVAPGTGVAPGASFEVLVRASTLSNPTGVEVGIDAVKAVTRVNRAPVAVSDAYSTDEDTTLTVTQGGLLANDYDSDGDALTAHLNTQAQHGVVALNPNGTFTYQPNANYVGQDEFTYHASDGQSESQVASVSLTVRPVNDAPQAQDDLYTATPGQTLTVAAPGVLINDTDRDNDALTAELVESVPAGHTLNLTSNGSFSYIAPTGFVGSVSFVYRARDGVSGSNPARVTIKVEGVVLDTRGTDFWLALPGNLSDYADSVFSISAEAPTRGKVEIPGLQFSRGFTVGASSSTNVQVPNEALIATDGETENKGIHITANGPISVYLVNFQQYETEGYLGLPVRSLGTEYRHLGYSTESRGFGGFYSQLTLVAPFNGTVVSFTPRAGSLSGAPANQTVTVSLSQGQTYQYRGVGDLSGTAITSNKPVAVYGGNVCADVPANYGYCNQLVEQLLPVQEWGQEFLTVPLATRKGGDTFRFLAAQDGTTVSINGTLVATLGAGAIHEQILTRAAHITSNKPLCVAQFSNGAQFDNSTADPFQMLAPSTSQYASRYTLTTPGSGIASNFLNLIVPQASTGKIKLDGKLLPSWRFSTISNSSYSGAQIKVGTGAHTVASTDNAEFGVFLYGYNNDDGYGYPGALGRNTAAPTTSGCQIVISTPTGQETVASLESVTGELREAQGELTASVAVQRQSDQLWWTGGGWGGTRNNIQASVGAAQANTAPWQAALPGLSGGQLENGDYDVWALGCDDDGCAETTRRVTAHQSRARLDFSIRKAQESEADFIGAGLYNTDGAGQTKSHNLESSGSVTYVARLSNTGDVAMSGYVGGSYPYDAWDVQYFDANDNDISYEIYDGYHPFEIAPGAWQEIKMQVSAGADMPPGSSFDGSLYAYQYDNLGYQQDVVRGVTTFQNSNPTATATPTPTSTGSGPQTLDAVISSPGGYIGDEIFNSDAQNQTSEQSTEGEASSLYAIALVNSADAPRSVTLTAPGFAADPQWQVSIRKAHVDAATGTLVADEDVTQAITGPGYPVVLAANNGGAPLQLIVRVMPTAEVAGGSVYDLLLLSRDDGGRNEVDAVRARTFKTGEVATPTPGPTTGPTSEPTPGPTTEPGPTAQPTIAPTPGGTPLPTATPPAPSCLTPDVRPEDTDPIGGVVTVTIVLPADAPAGAAIHYTRDGSEPTARSPRYTGPFFLVSATTVKARAYAPGCSPSLTDQETYNLGGGETEGGTDVNIAAPADGGEITQPTDVTGTVRGRDGISLVGWELGYRLLDGPTEYQVVASDTTSRENQTLGRLDPTLLLNGLYRLKLVGYYSNGTAQYDFHDIVVKGGMKIGHFSMSFNDITLPVAGLPISITRTYDSRDTRKGDFGVGWTLSTTDVRLQKNGPVGGTEEAPVWRMRNGLNPTYTSLKPRVISITLPDGQVYSFRARVNSQSQFTSLMTGQVVWTPQPGTRGKLTAVGSDTIYTQSGDQALFGEGNEDEDDPGDPFFGSVYDPKSWKLTLPSGVALVIKENGNMAEGGKASIESITDLNGNMLTFDANGIQSRNPDGDKTRAVTYERDGRGFITAIKDAKQQRVKYVQDQNGNLRTYTSRVSATTSFYYNNPVFAHYVTDIYDPRGVHVMEATYDSEGRLRVTKDIAGNTIQTDHDLPAKTETVTDRMGHVSVMKYDAYGNVERMERRGKTLDQGGNEVLTKVVSTSTYDLSGANPDQPTITTVYPQGENSPGLTTTYAYDGDGNLTGVREPFMEPRRMQYERGRLDREWDARGVLVLDNDYDAKGRLTSSQVPWKRGADDAVVYSPTQYVFAEGNNTSVPNKIVDALQNETHFSFNRLTGNVTGVTGVNADGGPNTESTFQYDPNGNKIGSTTYRTIGGVRTEIDSATQFDGEDRPVLMTSPLGVAGGGQSLTIYNAIGKVEETIRANGTARAQSTKSHYDDLGRRDTTTYPDGSVTRVQYNDNDQVARSFDRAGRSSVTLYDELNRAIGTQFYGANGSLVPGETRTVYDGADRAVASRDERGHWSKTLYDEANRTTISEDSVADALGGPQTLRSVTVMDAFGRTAYSQNPKGVRTEMNYDDAGRVVRTDYDVRYAPDGTRAVHSSSSSTFDELGRAVKEVNQSGKWKSFSYDSLGRLAAVMQPVDADPSHNLVTRFGYDEAGLKLWQKDAKGQVTRFAYDVAGRQVARQMPGGQNKERTRFDELGRVQSQTDFRGTTTTMSYDERGRLLSKIPDAALGEAAVTMSYPNEFTTIATRGSGANALSTTSVSDPQRGWLDYVITPTGRFDYGYDVSGNKTSVVSTAGGGSNTAGYSYDELGRLKEVRDNGMPLATIGYDLNGNRQSVFRANGVTSTYAYDSLDRLDTLSHAKGQTLLSSYGYTVRGDGKRTGVAESVVNSQSEAPRTSARTSAYAFDESGRLTGEASRDGQGVAYENAWRYDAAGNRVGETRRSATVAAPSTFASVTTTLASFNENDWLTRQARTTQTAGLADTTSQSDWSYDDNGKLLLLGLFSSYKQRSFSVIILWRFKDKTP